MREYECVLVYVVSFLAHVLSSPKFAMYEEQICSTVKPDFVNTVYSSVVHFYNL